MAGPFFAASLTFLLMLAAMYWHRVRRFHIPVMVSVMLFDIAMPFYLVSTRDWGKRLFTDGDILSFGMWMHFGLIITLFVLYAIQVHTAWQLVKASAEDEAEIRGAHRVQAKGILVARALVIATGAMLAEPAATA
jgi:hypothetical protein